MLQTTARGTARRVARPVAWPFVCGVVSAVLQLGFVLELVLPGEPSALRSQISELSAPGQPGAWLFRAFDVASGLLVLAIVPGWHRVSRTVGVSLAVWGLGLALAAVFSASCADSLHMGCLGSGLPGPHTGVRDDLHDVGSIASVLAVLLALVAAGVVLRRHGDARRGAVVLALGVTSCLLGLAETVEDVLGVSPLRGVSQRGQVLLLSVALVMLADPRRWPRAGARPGHEGPGP